MTPFGGIETGGSKWKCAVGSGPDDLRATDVNAAALAEHRWGACQGLDTFCYITVGTGIGGGGMAGGKLLHGLLHPEFGHMRIPHDRDADPFDTTGCSPSFGAACSPS